MRALADAVGAGRLPKLAVEKLDGEPVIGSPPRTRCSSPASVAAAPAS